MREAKSIAELRALIISKISDLFRNTFSKATEGMANPSIFKNPKVLFDVLPKEIEQDGVKKAMIEILRDSYDTFINSENSLREEAIVNIRILRPEDLAYDNLIKIVAMARKHTDAQIFTLEYLFSDGDIILIEILSVEHSMMIEQAFNETKKVLKRAIKRMKKELKTNQRFLTNMKEELEPYLFAEKI